MLRMCLSLKHFRDLVLLERARGENTSPRALFYTILTEERIMEELEMLDTYMEETDSRIVELLRRRMELSEKAAGIRRASGLPVPESELERTVLARAAEQAGDGLADCAQAVFRDIAAADRSRRNEASGITSSAYSDIKAALDSTPELFPPRATVACQGVEGAYSQIACDHLFKSPSIMYFDTFEHVFRAVEAGLCRFGVLPIENSAAGSVNAVYDLMLSHNFSIVRSARLKVSHCLLALPGAELSGIRQVYSHPQAINQCSAFLAGLKDVKVTAAENTAAAAKLVAESGRRDAAALCSRCCGENYGLKILRSGVQDSDGNYTRFICISRAPEIYPGADRLSMMMILPHRPGSLYGALSKFNALGLNVRKIESRPMPDRDFEFMFYFDVEASVYAPETEKLFRDLEASSERLRFLGAYSEILC